jgi:hypothetical protein
MPPQPSATTTARQPSGRSRYYTSQQAAAAITAAIVAAEIAILTAMASMTASVLAGSLLAGLAQRRFRAVVLAIITQADGQVAAAIAQASAAARADVERIIAADLGPLARLLPLIPSASMPRLSQDLRGALQTAANQAGTEFRAILADPAKAQSLLDELAGTGLTGKTGRDGRHWNLSSYAEMAARTAAERLHLELQVRALTEAGHDLAYVARDSSQPPCARCAPFVHRVLSLTGTSLGVPGVAGTLAQARASGLFHPQCRDSLVPYDGQMPSEPPHSPRWLDARQARYQAGQDAYARQRAYAAAQRQHAVALTPLARARARRLIRHLAP